MPSVKELTAPYGNFMLAPRAGPGVCEVCFNLTDGYTNCYACTSSERVLDAVCPISYSVAREQLHHALRGYKQFPEPVSRRLTVELAAVLWRHLSDHERCLAAAVGVDAFTLVTTVPSGDQSRARHHPLPRIVGELVEPTRRRHERLLMRSPKALGKRAFDSQKFEPIRQLAGESVLLIDDTWTTGTSAQSAAAALKAAGAGPVAAVVIGRFLNRDWHQNDRRLRDITQPFDWSRCALCAATSASD